MTVAGTQTFGRYRLLGEIGRGGEAIVHLAEDPVLKRRVALKIFPRTVTAGPAAAPPGFSREIEVLSRLHHPGICTVHDAGVEDGSAFIAMSYAEGRTLAAHSRLGEAEAARIGEDVAGIVAAAHAISVVHGDLTPANVLVTPEGRCIVLDFGVARLLDDAPQPPESRRVAGTLPYVAPECLLRSPDVRSDVHGLGAVLYELVAGRPPRSGPTRAALLAMIEREDPPLLRAVAPQASRDLEAVLARALDRDPARRYQTMTDFAADLARLRRGEPASARPLGPASRAMSWARRRPAAATLAALAFLFLAIAASVGVVKNRELGRHLERAGEAALRAGDAARAAEEHLSRYEQLSDSRRIADLEARAARCLTPHPDLLPTLEAWLADAEALARRLDQHREELAKVRSRARDSDARDLAGILATPTARELASLKARHARLVASSSPGPAIPQLAAVIQRLDASLPRRRQYFYASEADAWRDETLSALIAELERFADPDRYRGTIADVAQRVEDVGTLEETLAGSAAVWERACRSIADREECPRYGGLAIKPQLGLVPLRRNSASGLWEFLHVLSGEAPPDPSVRGPVVRPETGIVLVLVPGGIARMGARRPGPGDPPEGPHLDPLAALNESPLDDVALDPFFISKFEMTLPQWVRVRGQYPVKGVLSNPLVAPSPVFGITWRDATLALARLGLEVPTEAQWEYAARAGTTTPWWTGSDAASLRGAAAFSSPAGFAPVGKHRPNAFGLHDVAGNVSEWCRDLFTVYGGPRVPGTGESVSPSGRDRRVRRGGSAGQGPKDLCSSRRRSAAPTVPPGDAGVRPSRRLDR